MCNCGWSSSSNGSIGSDNLPQRINAGAFTSYAFNSVSALVTKQYGIIPGSDYSIDTCIDFPMVPQGNKQWWFVETSSPVNWTSEKLKFRVNFIIDQTVVLPGVYQFELGVRRRNDKTTPNGSNLSVTVDYTLDTTAVPQKKVTAFSSELTIPGGVELDPLLFFLTRGEPTDDESDSAYVTGIDVVWV